MNQFDIYWVSLPNRLGQVARGCERRVHAKSLHEAICKMRKIVSQRLRQQDTDIKAYQIENHAIY